MPAPRDPIRSPASAEPTLAVTPAGVTPDARLVDPNAPTMTPAAIAPGDPTRNGLARPPRAEEAPAPAAIGRFTVLRELGRGGTGVVYAAYDEQLDRKVAVKLLHSETREDLARARLLREAQAMARLSHPNIVGVHEVGTFGRQVYVAMEFVHGMTLHAWLKRKRRRFAEMVAMFRQAGEGLAAAHRAGLVHRDFKPANVMVGDDGRVRVLDFGLARAEAVPGAAPGLDDLEPAAEHASGLANLRSLDASITVTGVMLGTPAYMAPEQFLGTRVDARSDQFAFCVALYEAVYHVRPFPGDTLAELMAKVLAGDIDECPTPTGVPRGLRPMLLRGLKRAPDERWPAMQPLLAALAPMARPPARRAWVAAAGLAALCSGGAAAYTYQAGASEGACTGGEARVAAVWNHDVRARLSEVVAGTGLADAVPTWERVAAAFDRYGEAWIAGYADACEESDALLDLRMSCLDERREALATAIDMVNRVDAEMLARADQLIDNLPRIASCADETYLRAKVRPPEDPAVAAKVDLLRKELARAATLELGGKFDEALAVLAPARAAAPEHYPPLAAELALREGLILEHQGRYEDARNALEAGFFFAVESRHLEVAIDAATRLAYVVGRRLRDESVARDWLKHAEIYAQRNADDLRLARALTVRGALANVAQAMGMDETLQAEARDSFTRADELFRRAGATATVDYARYLRFYGDYLNGSERTPKAIEIQRESLTLMTRLLGAHHPDVGMVHNSLGLALLADKQYVEALATFKEGLDAAVDLEHQRNHIYMTLWINTANALKYLDRKADAEAPMREGIAVLERSSKRLLEDTYFLLVQLAQLELELGRRAEAEADARALLARAEQEWGPRAPLVMDVLLLLSKIRIAAGDGRDALAAAERALELSLAASTPSYRDFQHAARWAMAQALALQGEVPRALELAASARTFVATRPPKDAGPWLAEIDKFLARHASHTRPASAKARGGA